MRFTKKQLQDQTTKARQQAYRKAKRGLYFKVFLSFVLGIITGVGGGFGYLTHQEQINAAVIHVIDNITNKAST